MISQKIQKNLPSNRGQSLKLGEMHHKSEPSVAKNNLDIFKSSSIIHSETNPLVLLGVCYFF